MLNIIYVMLNGVAKLLLLMFVTGAIFAVFLGPLMLAELYSGWLGLLYVPHGLLLLYYVGLE